MKQIKVSEATNTQLDWLVAKCEGLKCTNIYGHIVREFIPRFTTDPAQMQPIMEREEIALSPPGGTAWWQAQKNGYLLHGPTMLIAAARCYVASKLGETAEVPQELS
jgi:hypothetical protein